MNSLDAVPAIRRIDCNRSDLLAIDVVDHVSPADAENLFGLLEAAYALHPQIDVLVRLVAYKDTDWGGLSEETMERGRADALAHVKRCATVGGPDWTGYVTGLFTTLPVELRHFDAEEEAKAWAWLDAKAT